VRDGRRLVLRLLPDDGVDEPRVDAFADAGLEDDAVEFFVAGLGHVGRDVELLFGGDGLGLHGREHAREGAVG
jgi:hypothetical protein